MAEIPEWATRAAEAHRKMFGCYAFERRAGGLALRGVSEDETAREFVRVLGPEREALEAERTSLLEQHAILVAKVGMLEADVKRLGGVVAAADRGLAELHADIVEALTKVASETARVATERAEVAEAACRLAEGLLKHVTRERDRAQEALREILGMPEPPEYTWRVQVNAIARRALGEEE